MPCSSEWSLSLLLSHLNLVHVSILSHACHMTHPPHSPWHDHPLSAVRDCLFNIFAATLHIWRPSPLSATQGRTMPWWQWTHLTWTLITYKSLYILVGQYQGFNGCNWQKIQV
jgi:hypothetical protein